MLQVARNLFTRLGELLYKNSQALDPFPIIHSRGIQVSVAGLSFSDHLLSSKSVKCGIGIGTSCNNNSSVDKYSFEKQLKQQEKIADLLTNKTHGKPSRYKRFSPIKSPSKVLADHLVRPPYRLPERMRNEKEAAILFDENKLPTYPSDSTLSSEDELNFKKQLKQNQKIAEVMMSSTPIAPVLGQYEQSVDIASPERLTTLSPVAGQYKQNIISPVTPITTEAEYTSPDPSAAIPEIVLESGNLDTVCSSSPMTMTTDDILSRESYNDRVLSGSSCLSPTDRRTEDTVSFCGSCQSPLSFATALDYTSFSDDDIDISSSSQNSTFEVNRSPESLADLDPHHKRSLTNIGFRNEFDNEKGESSVRISTSQPDIVPSSLTHSSIVTESYLDFCVSKSASMRRRSKEELCGVSSAEVVKSEMTIVVEDSDTSLAHTISLSLIPNLYSGAYPSYGPMTRSSQSTEYIKAIQAPRMTVQDSHRSR